MCIRDSVGRCHTNNAFMYDDKTYNASSKEELDKIIVHKKYQENVYHIAANTTPILTSKIDDVAAFYQLAEKHKNNSQQTIQQLKTSNLRGRGGAGFPFWFKLDAVLKEDKEQKYIVCNADEGDPGAYSDMYLMEHQPHKVLFGMYMAGLTVGANTGVLYIRGEYPDSIKIVNDAIEEIKEKNLVGDFKFKIIRGQGSYVCGEETALLSSIEGLRPEVRVRPPYPAQYGLYGKPTAVNNVISLATIPIILDKGSKFYADFGMGRSKGTLPIQLAGNIKQTGLVEKAFGITLRELLYDFGGGSATGKKIKAVQVGGPLGAFLPEEQFDTPLDYEKFSEINAVVGHGGIVAFDETIDMSKLARYSFEFCAIESCGKCTPCRIGSTRGMEVIDKIKGGIDQEKNVAVLRDLGETMVHGSLCAMGGMTPFPVISALNFFPKDFGLETNET